MKTLNPKKSLLKIMSYVVAIPSYDRPDTIANKTLKTILDGGVPKNLVHVFVANKAEEKRYIDALPKSMYGKLVVGKKGITAQRRFIIEYFPENKKVVSIDDDIEGLFEKVSDKELRKITNVHKFFIDAFAMLEKERLYIWGIYPVHNPYFMKNTITTDLKFIVGQLYGFVNRKIKTIQPSQKIFEKEDYEQSIKYFLKDGGVVRFNNVSAKTKNHAKGGLGIREGRLEANRAAAEYLRRTYPAYVNIFCRANGMTEVRLSRKTKQNI